MEKSDLEGTIEAEKFLKLREMLNNAMETLVF